METRTITMAMPMKANVTHRVTSSFHCRMDFDVEDSDSYVLTPFDYVHIKTSRMREACALHVSAITLDSLNLLTVICLAIIIKGYESRYRLFSPADPTSQQLGETTRLLGRHCFFLKIFPSFVVLTLLSLKAYYSCRCIA